MRAKTLKNLKESLKQAIFIFRRVNQHKIQVSGYKIIPLIHE